MPIGMSKGEVEHTLNHWMELNKNNLFI